MDKRRFVVGWALAAVAGVCLTASLAQAQSPAQALTDRAQQMLVQRQFQQALEALDEAIGQDKNYAPAHYFRGMALGNLNRTSEALDEFVAAAELNPGWGEAHRMATVAALDTSNLEVAWDQAIKAYQSGTDIAQELNRLLAMERAPSDLDSQLSAARIYVMPLNTEKLAAREDNPWGVNVTGAGGGGGIPDPFTTSATRATSVGETQITQSQANFYSLLTQTRRSLADSKLFGVVPRQDMAQYLMVIEVDKLGEGGQQSLDGYIKLYDPRSGEEVYRRVLELRNIASLADLNADIERYIDYMEEWLENRVG